MKKIILFLVLLSSTLNVYASPNTDTINKIENSLFGFTYSNDSEISRLNRIEKEVYGKTSNSQTTTRIAKLKKDLSADLIGQEIPPKEDTFAKEEDSIVYENEPKESGKIDYPVINELEKEVFKKEFKDQNIKTRLSNLENKTFGKSFPTEDLSTRVEKLKAEIKPQRFMANGLDQQENFFYKQPATRMSDNYHLDQYGSPFDYDDYNNRNSMSYNSNFESSYNDNFLNSPSENIFKPAKNLNLSKIEKTLYKEKYENEPTGQRLTRIESSIFGTNFANDSESERIARISSAINAQKSAQRYDSNRFGQNMATAFQIGTLILMVLACIL